MSLSKELTDAMVAVSACLFDYVRCCERLSRQAAALREAGHLVELEVRIGRLVVYVHLDVIAEGRRIGQVVSRISLYTFAG